MKATDRHFDDIADKFVSNIYGTTKGRLRHLLLVEAMAPFLETPSKIIELGGGSGIMTKTLADQGHTVTLTDASAEILGLAQQMLADYPAVQIQHASYQQVTDFSPYQMVVCHAMLEWLAEPFAALDHLAQHMPAKSRLSLSFFNRDAALFTNAVYGNFDYIARGLNVKNQVKLNPINALRPAQVIEHVQDLGFNVLAQTGIRCFHDYMKNKPDDEAVFAQLLELERTYGRQAPFCWLGKYFHLMLEKA